MSQGVTIKGKTASGANVEVRVDDSGQLVVSNSISGLITSPYDYVAITYPNDTTDVFTFKNGGAGGTTVGVITITYVDNTKALMSTVEKT